MNDAASRIFGSIPTGRRLEQADYDPSYLGTVGPLYGLDGSDLDKAEGEYRR